MSLRSFVKKFDPTSSKSEFGKYVKTALPYIPVVGGALNTAVDVKNGLRTAGGSSSSSSSDALARAQMVPTPPGSPPATISPPAAPAYATPPASGVLAFVQGKGMTFVLALVVLVAVVLFARRK